MRRLALVAVALLVVLAGCSGPFGGNGPSSATETPGPEDTGPPEPTADPIGWHDGYWHNESLAIDHSDGLNESELDAVVSRSMARVEYLREREFDEDVAVEIISREDLNDRFEQDDHPTDFRTFDNGKFEALFMVGSDTDSLQVQQENAGASILGFYEPDNDTIKMVAEDGTLRIDDETTLGHELEHALQDQLWNLSAITAETRDSFNGKNSLVEGDASLLDSMYGERCGAEWECLSTGNDGLSQSDLHYGIYFMEFFRYADGEVFVTHHYDRGGWDAVDAMFEAPPDTAVEVIYPDRYGEFEPVDPSLTDDLGGGWDRVRPESDEPGRPRPDYATLGQASLSAMFAHTFSSQLGNTPYDSYNSSSVIGPRQFINGGTTDPYNYDLAYTSGWTGDRLHVYERSGETAYAWKLTWESDSDAETFADGYRKLLSHWGGDRVTGSTWTIPADSPFTGAYYLQVDGDAVTVVKAPSQGALDDVAPAGVTPD